MKGLSSGFPVNLVKGSTKYVYGKRLPKVGRVIRLLYDKFKLLSLL